MYLRESERCIEIGNKEYLRLCNITYDMDFRFIPSDPMCFDKLSRCDE